MASRVHNPGAALRRRPLGFGFWFLIAGALNAVGALWALIAFEVLVAAGADRPWRYVAAVAVGVAVEAGMLASIGRLRN